MNITIRILILSVLLSSCVSMKDYQMLEDRMKAVEFQLSSAFDDDDGDGVVNQLDQEKNTEAGCWVDSKGVTLDTDEDGIANCKDTEPFSPAGFEVDDKGVAKVPRVESVNEDIVNLIVDAKLSEYRASQESDPIPIPIPSVKLPVPTASATVEVPDAFFMNASTYGSIYNHLAVELGNSGYTDQRYFQTIEAGQQVGFAIMTGIEEIGERGERKQFSPEITKEVFTCGFDLSCIYNKLSPSTTGVYRTFLIVVKESQRDKPYNQPVSGVYFNNLFEGGATSFNGLGLSEKTTKGFDCHVYVYEFEKKQEKEPVTLKLPSKLTASQHLEIVGMRPLYYMPQ